MYDVRTGVVDTHKMQISYDFSGAAAWVRYQNGVVYTDGRDRALTSGNGYSKRTLFFNPARVELTAYPDINKERGGHCMIVYKSVIYMFGGFDGSNITHCEKFENGSWQWLPHLT